MTSCAYHSPLYMYIITIGDYCTIINQPHTLYLIQLDSNWHSCWYSYSLIALAGTRTITGYTRTSKSTNYYLILLGSV